MNGQPLKRIVILGGGTAGWLSAAMLTRVVRKSVEIVLVESDEIGIVGVGEATIPPLVNLFIFLGIPEAEMLSRVQGTYKLGIEFVNWGQKGERYIHAFGNPGRDLGIVPFYQYWLKAQAERRGGDLWDYSLNAQAAFANRYAPLKQIDGGIEGLTHAWHFDAGLLARYLRAGCETQGVIRKEGKVTGVNLRPEDGFIASLNLESGETVDGDMFIDCSGFRGVLIEEALEAGYEEWSHWLPNDRAIAVPSKNTGPLLPYTRATAHTAGWQWRIPLQHRIGNGHVFSSGFMGEDEATRILLDNLDGQPLADPRTIRFTTGRRRQTWVKNCLALGLASGFLEPLESTSIHLVQSGMTRFLKLFPDTGFNPLTIAEYNRQTSHEYELVRDFIILHYHATRRSDSDYWNHCRTLSLPDSLAHKIAYFREHGRLRIEEADLFRESNWAQVLIGQNILPAHASPLTHAVEDAALNDYMANIKRLVAHAVTGLPTHADFIARHCKAS
ncbi:tryptophan halogenase family protein [Asticcacaulis sp. AND118]|uniref:tryptophan halogenase family protein n=1 Tax=Asticcacaulis sp. AND118 TaxID=2840468 RepID=UPI001CFFFA2B|nr:tryptophan halogenase family protein [Asticcacaulis sp. AND118]UDF03190.1 tryptophan 7-halogenase [Asticcacaulis sp. AND118]